MQLVMSFVGALGFALFFDVRPRHILPASIGGLITFAVYWVMLQLMGQLFLPSVIASAVAAAYAEVVARISRVPSTAFFIISVIPLVPGRGLFYSMSDAVNANWAALSTDSMNTLLTAAGIAAGICIVTACVQTWEYAKRRIARLARLNKTEQK